MQLCIFTTSQFCHLFRESNKKLQQWVSQVLCNSKGRIISRAIDFWFGPQSLSNNILLPPFAKVGWISSIGLDPVSFVLICDCTNVSLSWAGLLHINSSSLTSKKSWPQTSSFCLFRHHIFCTSCAPLATSLFPLPKPSYPGSMFVLSLFLAILCFCRFQCMKILLVMQFF